MSKGLATKTVAKQTAMKAAREYPIGSWKLSATSGCPVCQAVMTYRQDPQTMPGTHMVVPANRMNAADVLPLANIRSVKDASTAQTNAATITHFLTASSGVIHPRYATDTKRARGIV